MCVDGPSGGAPVSRLINFPGTVSWVEVPHPIHSDHLALCIGVRRSRVPYTPVTWHCVLGGEGAWSPVPPPYPRHPPWHSIGYQGCLISCTPPLNLPPLIFLHDYILPYYGWRSGGRSCTSTKPTSSDPTSMGAERGVGSLVLTLSPLPCLPALTLNTSVPAR